MKTYFAFIHKDPDSVYGVSFSDVPGCTSAGETYEEAVANAAEALSLHEEVSREQGYAFPSPRPLDELMADPEFVEEAAGAAVAGIPLLSGESQVAVTIPLATELLEAIDRAARARGISRADFIAGAARASIP